jgi:hypothetical protein
LTPATHLMLYRLRTGVAGRKMRCRVEAARDVKLLRPKGLGINLAIAFGRAMAIRRGVARRWPRRHNGAISRQAGTGRGHRRGVLGGAVPGGPLPGVVVGSPLTERPEKQAATAPSQGNGKASICKRGEWTS